MYGHCHLHLCKLTGVAEEDYGRYLTRGAPTATKWTTVGDRKPAWETPPGQKQAQAWTALLKFVRRSQNIVQ